MGCQHGAMATYVLVPGAWLGAWAWRDVTRALRSRGHDVHPITLTGLGDRVHLARPDVDLDTHVTDVLNTMAFEDLRDVVLVGHSYAGLVVTGVADRAPERLSHVVYLDTGPLPPGQALVDFNPPDAREAQRRTVEERGDGWRLPFPAFADLGTPAGLAGLTDDHRALMEARATPQPFATFTQPLDYTPPQAPPWRRTVVLCGGFGMGAAGFRQLVASGNPQMALFAAPDWQVEELDTGHWPMLSRPAELGALLDRLAAGEAPAAGVEQQRQGGCSG
jgi:pimeloyl-ACP methyl ester carboxylesterase